MIESRPAERYIQSCRYRSKPDWEHAPLPFKLYRHCERIPLSTETLTTLSLNQDENPIFSLGLLLYDIYGIIRTHYFGVGGQKIPDTETQASDDSPYLSISSFSRAVASGGARFPCELYMLVNAGQDLAEGLYHYDPLHHSLDLLRTGNFTPILLGALARPPEKQPAYTLLFSVLFWKDAFKYQEFSYRLQGLDAGCLLAQSQIVTERYALQPMLHFQFLDHLLNQLLGFNQMEESVYAVITLEADCSAPLVEQKHSSEADISLVNELPPTLERYEPLSRWPSLEAVHRASCNETRADLPVGTDLSPLALPTSASDLVIELPSVACAYRRTHIGRRRSASLRQFRPHPLTLQQLALLLQTCQRGYQGDLGEETSYLAQALLYCMINHVEGVPPGIYVYQAEQHLLRQVRAGEFQRALQITQPGMDVNMKNLSLCIFPVGNYVRGFSVHGDRWYRMQNMQAGMMVQRLYLAAAISGLGCRASLNYSDEHIDIQLDLPADYTALCQIFISPLAMSIYNDGLYEQSLVW